MNHKKKETMNQARKMNTGGPPTQTAGMARPTHFASRAVHPEFNVYATSFVPDAYKQINREQGRIIDTVAKNRIVYPDYIQTFVAQQFLPPDPLPAVQQPHSDTLSNHRYLEYFSKLWSIEKAAKLRENEQHAMYKVPVQQYEQDSMIFTIQIPGLREDNPLVEMGDTIQLRAIFVDASGNLVDINPFYHHTKAPTQPRYWTGMICNAAVHHVHRASETVYFKADGLGETWLGSVRFLLYVNVVFPPKVEANLVTEKTLVYVDHMLKEDDLMDESNMEPKLQDSSSATSKMQTLGGNHLQLLSLLHQQETVPVRNSWIRQMLFPCQADGQWQTKLRRHPDRGLFDPQLNYEQVHAVSSVCKNDYGTLPYCISGPPGTGKTKTLVEMAMQLLKDNTVDHILICAPSDQAADTLAIRLKKYLNSTQLLRLMGPARHENEIHHGLRGTGYTYTENDMFCIPPFKQLMKYNVVVTSCRDASILTQARLTNADIFAIQQNMFTSFHPERDIPPPPPLHWGALLMDEAAQAVELDVLPAISVVCPPAAYPPTHPQPRFVMAGDEKQLGPRTASRDPDYSRSLFARILDCPLYKQHPMSRSNMNPSLSPPVLSKDLLPMLYPPFANLVRNYRSHPAILSVPSALFYNDTLIPMCEQPLVSTPLQRSSIWRGRKWPVLFVPNTGADEIEQDGGGWYNKTEATQAITLAHILITSPSRIPATSICITSPFAAQVRLLRALIRGPSYSHWTVNIGPLEAFQGLEHAVMIICTTRTRAAFVQQDIERGQGIIGLPRKMNVALTRAREGVVVIGDARLLGADREGGWKEWLGFCVRNGLVAGDRKVRGEVMREFEEDEDEGGGARVGVMEKALVAKEVEATRGVGRALGDGVVVGVELDGGFLDVDNYDDDDDDDGDDGDGKGEEDEDAYEVR